MKSLKNRPLKNRIVRLLNLVSVPFLVLWPPFPHLQTSFSYCHPRMPQNACLMSFMVTVPWKFPNEKAWPFLSRAESGEERIGLSSRGVEPCGADAGVQTRKRRPNWVSRTCMMRVIDAGRAHSPDNIPFTPSQPWCVKRRSDSCWQCGRESLESILLHFRSLIIQRCWKSSSKKVLVGMENEWTWERLRKTNGNFWREMECFKGGLSLDIVICM